MVKLFSYRRSPREDNFDYIIYFSKDSKSKGFYNHWTKAIKIIDKKLDLTEKKWRTNQNGFNYLKRMEMEINDPRHAHDLETCEKAIQDPVFGGNPVADAARERVKKFYAEHKIEMKQEMNNLKPYTKDIKKAEFIINKTDNKVTDYENMGSHLKLEPYVYQKEIIKFCLEKENALIVAPCGAGKTPMILGIFDEAKRAGKIKGPGIIVVKASLKNQWQEEVKKFTNYKAIIINTLAKMKNDQKAFEAQFIENDLYILNYESLRDEKIRKQMKKIKADFMACDEIQYIKESTTKRSRAIYEFNNTKFRIGATATPVMKNPLDIFGIFKFINPELFPKKEPFGARYVEYEYFGLIKRPKKAKNEIELNEKISPYMIIKSKEEVSEHLPELQIIQRFCQFTPKQQKASDKLIEMLNELHEEEHNVIKKLVKMGATTSEELKSIEARVMMYQSFAQMLAVDEILLEVSDSPRANEFVTGSQSNKMKMVIELIKEIIDSGEKVAIFSRFVNTADIIKNLMHTDNELKGYKVAVVNGHLSADKRYTELYTNFRDNDNYKVLICSDAASEGVNLSRCRYIIETDLAQSYATQTQRHGRIERADSIHETVYVYQLLYENSYDDIAMKIINKKEDYDKKIIKGITE